MFSKNTKQLVFFIVVFLLFFLSVKLARFWIENGKEMNPNIVYIIMGIIYSLVLATIYYLSKLNSSEEGYWDVSRFAICKGGPYFYQGDSETAKMCRELASTPEGRCGISSYNCAKGMIGQPSLPFVYTAVSGDSWENERCEDTKQCPCDGTSLCSSVAQVM